MKNGCNGKAVLEHLHLFVSFLFTQFFATINFRHCEHPLHPSTFSYAFTTSTTEERFKSWRDFFFTLRSALYTAERCIFYTWCQSNVGAPPTEVRSFLNSHSYKIPCTRTAHSMASW
ncbi:hypothetical protein TGS27_1144 [Geobacillus stearothermophilus]|nr:hypothetical protein TGS27_1144 [Geobacillus stearothermophilus]